MENTNDLDRLYVSEIENVAVLRSAEAGALYNSPGGVILVFLRKDFSQVAENINTKIIAPLGWQKPSRFYSPDYSLKQDREAVTYDNRTTLYWNPFIRTDANGVAEISFYTSDRKTEYRFSIERVTSDGDYIAILKNLWMSGYEPLIIENPFKHNEKSFFLSQKTITLQETVIVADRFSRDQKIKAFKEQSLKRQESAWDMCFLNNFMIL